MGTEVAIGVHLAEFRFSDLEVRAFTHGNSAIGNKKDGNQKPARHVPPGSKPQTVLASFDFRASTFEFRFSIFEHRCYPEQ